MSTGLPSSTTSSTAPAFPFRRTGRSGNGKWCSMQLRGGGKSRVFILTLLKHAETRISATAHRSPSSYTLISLKEQYGQEMRCLIPSVVLEQFIQRLIASYVGLSESNSTPSMPASQRPVSKR